MRKVELHKINHRGDVQIAINTPYEKGIVERIKGLPNVRWSQTHRCGYVKEEQDAVNRIYNSLKKYCYVDYSTLKKETKLHQKRPANQLETKRSNVSRRELKQFVNKIKLKNYSINTLKTYQNCFSVFLLYTQHISKDVGDIIAVKPQRYIHM